MVLMHLHKHVNAEGLEMTCRNDAKGGPGPVQLGQQLHGHHPFGQSPECHANLRDA